MPLLFSCEDEPISKADSSNVNPRTAKPIQACFQPLPNGCFSHKEIAVLLNISEGTSKSNYHHAKLTLRDKINEINKLLKPKAL